MFVNNQPAMVIKDALIVADIHIGIANEINGIRIPDQSKALSEKINKLHKLTKTKRLVIIGDVKHKYTGVSWNEKKDMQRFLNNLNYKDIIITKGNHDGGIERLVNDNITKVKKNVIIGNWLLTHGHRKINTKKNIIIGHNHASIRFRDKMGAYYTEPVWLIGEKHQQKIIIMPAFNELSGTLPINSKKKAEIFMGPVAKHLKPAETRVYLLDSTDIGTVKDLMKNGIQGF